MNCFDWECLYFQPSLLQILTSPPLRLQKNKVLQNPVNRSKIYITNVYSSAHLLQSPVTKVKLCDCV